MLFGKRMTPIIRASGDVQVCISIKYSFKRQDALEALIAYNWAHVFRCTIFQKLILYTFCKQISIVLKNCGNKCCQCFQCIVSSQLVVCMRSQQSAGSVHAQSAVSRWCACVVSSHQLGGVHAASSQQVVCKRSQQSAGGVHAQSAVSRWCACLVSSEQVVCMRSQKSAGGVHVQSTVSRKCACVVNSQQVVCMRSQQSADGVHAQSAVGRWCACVVSSQQVVDMYSQQSAGGVHAQSAVSRWLHALSALELLKSATVRTKGSFSHSGCNFEFSVG